MSKEKYITRPLKWAFYPEEQGYGSDCTTIIEVDDGGGGEFLKISQPFANTELVSGCIGLDPDEWLGLVDAVDKAFAEIEKHKRAPEEEDEDEEPLPSKPIKDGTNYIHDF